MRHTGMDAGSSLCSNTVVRSSGTEVRIVDAHATILDGLGPGSAWPRFLWTTISHLVQPLSDTLLGLACLSMAAVIVVLLGRGGDGRTSSRSRWTVWMLGAILVVSGISQLARAVAMSPMDGRAETPLLAAVACWAVALCLQSSATRGRATSSDPEPAGRDEPGPVAGAVDPSADTIVVVRGSPDADPRRLEDDLRRSEARVKEFAEADARKNEFLAILGHELRNPLAPIRNAVRIMKRRGMDDPDLCWARDVVEHQLRQLNQLVDDLQEISRVTGGKVRLEKEPVDVATIVAFAVETSRPTIDAHRHRLSITLPLGTVLIDADQGRMAQVLSNLLNNAAKYTEDGGQIRLGVAVVGSEVVFRVRDNGVGIPVEMLPQVFDLFAQVGHSLDRAQGGLGLGLTLVRSLTEMHGGSVEARSEGPGRGSEFLVRLPILTRARTAPGLAPRPEAPARSRDRILIETLTPSRHAADSEVGPAEARPARRVLVVDDNDSAAQSMAMILKLEGYDVQVAFDGASGLEAVRSFRPAMILMDIGLPGIDGYEMARRIRQDPELNAGLELLAAVTGYAEPEARRRSREAGFDQHLVKPVDPEAVLALLAGIVHQSI
jgi:signal transduction histidine kinase/ActR/RegA family two-component response regulator